MLAYDNMKRGQQNAKIRKHLNKAIKGGLMPAQFVSLGPSGEVVRYSGQREISEDLETVTFSCFRDGSFHNGFPVRELPKQVTLDGEKYKVSLKVSDRIPEEFHPDKREALFERNRVLLNL